MRSDDFRSKLPRFTPEALKANQAMVDLLSGIAAQKKVTPAQIALAGFSAPFLRQPEMLILR